MPHLLPPTYSKTVARADQGSVFQSGSECYSVTAVLQCHSSVTVTQQTQRGVTVAECDSAVWDLWGELTIELPRRWQLEDL